MKKFDYLIVAGGRIPPAIFLRKCMKLASRIVAVDRGYDSFSVLKVKPDLFVGDGDSVSKNPIASKVVLLPPRKNLSDLEFTLRSLPATSTKLILGAHLDDEGRSDHAFINFLLALKYKNIFFADENSWVTGLQNQKVRIQTSSRATFSLVSPGKVSISVQGARYNLSNVVLQSPTHGLSNETLVKKTVTISVKGRALLFVNVSWSKSKINL